jgi:hypothetical protein
LNALKTEQMGMGWFQITENLTVNFVWKAEVTMTNPTEDIWPSAEANCLPSSSSSALWLLLFQFGCSAEIVSPTGEHDEPTQAKGH